MSCCILPGHSIEDGAALPLWFSQVRAVKGFFFPCKDQSKTQKMPNDKYLTFEDEKRRAASRESISWDVLWSECTFCIAEIGARDVVCKNVSFTRKKNHPGDLWEITGCVYTLWFV